MATRQDRLNQLAEIRNPELRMARILADRTIAKAILKLGTLIGSDGYTPIKGKDYFTQEDINYLVQVIRSVVKDGKDGISIKGDKGKDGYTPIKGKDYFDGKTPIKGKDYFDGKDGISPVEKDDEPIEYKDIKNAPDLKDLPALIEFLKRGGFRGGGSSSTGTVAIVYTETPTGLINSSNVTYHTAHTITNVYSFAVNGQFLHPTSDYTFTGTTITLVTALDSSLSGKPFTITYS